MILFQSANCLSKLERVKLNMIKLSQCIEKLIGSN